MVSAAPGLIDREPADDRSSGRPRPVESAAHGGARGRLAAVVGRRGGEPEPDTGVRAGWRARLAQRWVVGARMAPSATGALALVGLAAVVILVAVLSWWPQRDVGQPVPLAVGSPLTPTTSVRAGPIVVSVVGQVNRPGLVTMAPGARVADAVRAAGDAVPGADLRSVNLARRVRDGEQVLIGLPAPAQQPPSGQPGADGSKIDLNTATVAALDELPGVGKVTATRIIDWRDKHGGFREVDQLREVPGIGDARLATLRELVTV